MKISPFDSRWEQFIDFDKDIPGFNKKAFLEWAKENPEGAHIEDRRGEGAYFAAKTFGAPPEILKQFEHKLYGFEGVPEDQRPSTVPREPEEPAEFKARMNKEMREGLDELIKRSEGRSERNKK